MIGPRILKPGTRVNHPTHGDGTVVHSYKDDSTDVEFDKETGWGESVLRVTTSLLKVIFTPKETK